MMTSELLSHLNELHVMVRALDGQLIVTGPKGALTPALRAELSERKAEIVTFLNNGIRVRWKEPPLQRAARNGKAPLSFAQQRLWFLDQYEPNSSVYNIASALRFKGSLNIGVLEQSLNEIIRRHESLRTTFLMVDGEAVQAIAPSVAHSLAVVDLRDRLGSEGEEEARRLVSEEARQPFDPTQGPLFRIKLLRLSEDDHVLLLTLHHIVSDGWSMGVLYRELSVLYEAFSHSRPSPLPELPIQYADYAVWQREWLQGEVLDRQLSYWKKQLEGIPAVLNLPTNRPRPAVQGYRGARQSIELSKELSEGLKALSRKEDVTLFMTLLAAFQTLLYRYTAQEDVVVGSPIANRNRTEIEGSIGFFVNTLVLRTKLSGNPTFRELLHRVRKIALEAYEHQDLTFEKLVEELKPERNSSYSPLFQVMLVLQNVPITNLSFDGLSVSPLRINSETAKFDLTVFMSESEDGLRGLLEYNTDLFDEATILRMTDHFRVLLEGIATNPERRISELPMLTEGERDQQLVEWNETKRDYPKDKCIHQLFEGQVAESPDAIAVVSENQQITYRELNTRANQLAHYLRRLKVGPETLVGICVERSLEMVVGLLGVLKAGGAYVPLDPEYPKERLAFMLKDSHVPVLLTQANFLSRLPEMSSDGRPATNDGRERSPVVGLRSIVCLDTNWEIIAKEDENNLTGGATAENLAYVIYTSGSTGGPKGVQVQHRSVVNLLCSTRERPGLTHQDRLLAVTTLSFDIAGLELYLPLTVGAQITLVSREIASDNRRLKDTLATFGITVMQATPSTWAMLLDKPWEDGRPLKILCGGEALPKQLADQLLRRSASLWNMYGPTETTIWSANCRVSAKWETIYLGRPIANTQLYIADDYLQPVPVGVSGHLYIAGDGLARGYLNRADLTGESFLPNPFGKDPGARLYKTGDRVRCLPDGSVEFLGRIDHQIKIRGYRIELGEIETVLSQHPAVREAVVIAREESGNPKSETCTELSRSIGNLKSDKRLVAYATLRSGQPLDATAARSFLKEKLPEYMVPGEFVFLDHLPRTQNGKLDRNALLEMQARLPTREAIFTVARDELELQLTQVWEKILRRRPIGLKDNFFDLGGHSLLAVRLMSQVEKLTGRGLSLASLFQAPTIEEQAELVRSEGWSSPWSSLVAIQPGGSKAPFFCVHAHDGNVLFWRELSRRLGADQPFYGLQAQGLDGKQAPDTRIEDMASRYVREIRLLQPEGPYFLGGHCMGGVVAFEIAQQLQAQGEKVALLALMDSFAPLGRQTVRMRVPLRHRVKHCLALIRLHIDNLMLVGWEEKLSYVEMKFNRLLYKLYMSVGASWVPAAQARRRILKASIQALRSYNPKVYPGSITLFRATELPAGVREEPQVRWGELAAGGLEVHLIPGYFSQTVYEPRVRVLAEKLQACLTKAEACSSLFFRKFFNN